MHNTRYQDNVRHLVASAAEGYSVRNHNGDCGARKCSPLDNYELLNTELNFVGDGGILTTVKQFLFILMIDSKNKNIDVLVDRLMIC